VCVNLQPNADVTRVTGPVADVARAELSRLDELRARLLAETVPVY